MNTVEIDAKIKELTDEGSNLVAEHKQLGEANATNSRRMAEIKVRVDFINGAIAAFNEAKAVPGEAEPTVH